MIKCIRTYRLSHKLDEPFGFSQWHYDTRNGLLVEIIDDSGTVGWGECYGPSEVTQCGINSFYAPLLIGWDPLRNEAAWQQCWRAALDFSRSGVMNSACTSVKHFSVELGGKKVDGPGFFMEPTVLSGVTTEMTIAGEEIFGPVLSIIKYSDSDDEITLANGVEYRLAAYVFTTNISNGLKAARDIDAGSVCINEPHYSVQLPHGGLKQSGTGKDCSRYSLQEYLTLKRVSILIDK